MAIVVTIQRANGTAAIKQTITGAERIHFRYIAQEGDLVAVTTGEPELTPPALGPDELPGYLLVSEQEPAPAPAPTPPAP